MHDNKWVEISHAFQMKKGREINNEMFANQIVFSVPQWGRQPHTLCKKYLAAQTYQK